MIHWRSTEQEIGYWAIYNGRVIFDMDDIEIEIQSDDLFVYKSLIQRNCCKACILDIFKLKSLLKVSQVPIIAIDN